MIESKEKISKVAICPQCDSCQSAAHISIVDNKLNKEFMRLSDKGYIIKLETAEETRNRNFFCNCLKK